MHRFLAIFTLVITLSATGAQANNMGWHQYSGYIPNGVAVPFYTNTGTFDQISLAADHQGYANQVRITYVPNEANAEVIDLIAWKGQDVRTEKMYDWRADLPLYDNSITANNWLSKQVVHEGAWPWSEEAAKGDWHNTALAMASSVSGYDNSNLTPVVPGTLGSFMADGKRSDPADAGDLLIHIAMSPTASMDDVIQTMNYGWTADVMARTDPADAGYLLQPMLLAHAGF